METLKQHLEICYNNDYTSLSTEVRNIALHYAQICLQHASEKGMTHAKSSHYVYLLQLIAEEIDRIGQNTTSLNP